MNNNNIINDIKLFNDIIGQQITSQASLLAGPSSKTCMSFVMLKELLDQSKNKFNNVIQKKYRNLENQINYNEICHKVCKYYNISFDPVNLLAQSLIKLFKQNNNELYNLLYDNTREINIIINEKDYLAKTMTYENLDLALNNVCNNTLRISKKEVIYCIIDYIACFIDSQNEIKNHIELEKMSSKNDVTIPESTFKLFSWFIDVYNDDNEIYFVLSSDGKYKNNTIQLEFNTITKLIQFIKSNKINYIYFNNNNYFSHNHDYTQKLNNDIQDYIARMI